MIINRPSSASTPPNCAICLGNCTNKCFSDSCMHQFCFQCLLEWSKIKAECPLCKQSFKSIIHNVKSNEEYDEHIVEVPRNDDVRLIGNEDMWFLPVPIPPSRHEFHVRTTFTVDSRGEHAIQEMLLTHPLAASGRMTINNGIPRNIYPNRHRRDYSATSFRRSIYAQNLWVTIMPDFTGRYRDCSPTFFRNNPAARQRLVPWLNRELNALLFENTQLIMHLVDLVMEQLLLHHICSRTFRNLLHEYLDMKTDHFVHEFYSFMRSPFDMIGYDRNVIYANRPQSPAPILEDDTVEIPDNSDDSDVVVVGETTPAQPITIDLVDSNSDSDEPILVSSSNDHVPMPLPAPSITNDSADVAAPPMTVREVSLPAKLRHKQMSIEERNDDRRRWSKKRQRRRSNSTSSNSSDERNKREKESYRRYKRKKLLKKLKQRKYQHIDSASESTEINITTETEMEDEKPLINLIKGLKQEKKWRSRRELSRKPSRRESFTMTTEPKVESSCQLFPIDLSTPSCSRFPSGSSSSSRYHIELPKTRSTVELSDNGQYTSVQIETSAGLADNYEPSTSKTKIKIVRNGRNSPQHSRQEPEESGSSTEPYRFAPVKSEIR